jgi:hypothetical protein
MAMMTSRSNWAKQCSMFSVGRPIDVVVLKLCVTAMKVTSRRSNPPTVFVKSSSARESRSTLLHTMQSTLTASMSRSRRWSAGRPNVPPE